MKGLIRGAAGAVGLVAAVAGTGAFDDNTTRSDTGAIVDSGGLGAFEIRIGDCFDNPDPAATTVVSVQGIPCSQPHDHEAYAAWDLPDGRYPGQEVVRQVADDGCYGRFAPYVGATYEASSLDFSYLVPTEITWAEGDREIICILRDMRDAKLTGSAYGARI